MMQDLKWDIWRKKKIVSKPYLATNFIQVMNLSHVMVNSKMKRKHKNTFIEYFSLLISNKISKKK
jgi:hypothetical protein